VVDGASEDRTSDVLKQAKNEMGDRLQIIREEQREGFVKAANKGFRVARGRNLTWLNDDARPIDNALDQAVAQIDAEPADVAFVAMFHHWHSQKNIAYETNYRGQIYRLCHVRGTFYANFPVGKTSTYKKLGYFDERYYVCAADPDLSLAAWNAGMRVVPAYGAIIDHDELVDRRRQHDTSRGDEDNAKLFAKWDLPERNPAHNDFDALRPSTLRGLRNIAKSQAA
jgi:GT2 family glycosyltransferase